MKISDCCKDIGTKYLSNRKYIKTYISKEVNEFLDDTSTGSRSVKTVTVSAQGMRSEGRRTISTITKRYKKVKYTYNVDVFEATYNCSSCDTEEVLIEEDRTLLSRDVLGVRSETRDR